MSDQTGGHQQRRVHALARFEAEDARQRQDTGEFRYHLDGGGCQDQAGGGGDGVGRDLP